MNYSMKSIVGKIVMMVVGLLCFTACNGISSDSPDSMLKVAALKIEKYEIEYRDDNLERTASAWDNYTYILKLPTPVDKSLVSRLKELVKTDPRWEYLPKGNIYRYEKVKPDDNNLSIYIELTRATVRLDYYVYDWLA